MLLERSVVFLLSMVVDDFLLSRYTYVLSLVTAISSSSGFFGKMNDTLGSLKICEKKAYGYVHKSFRESLSMTY